MCRLLFRCMSMLVYFLRFVILFFFFKQKTAYEMRISDWSSDVCSSDLLPEAEERALIAASLDMIERVIGTRPRGWMSIARSQSFNTPRLLAEAGFVYMCDWVNDELPYRFATGADRKSTRLNSSH